MKSILLLWFSAYYGNLTTSQIVDDLERQLGANRDAYLSGPHTAARQQAYLQFFDDKWAWLQSSDACGSRLLGKAGTACLADRAPDGRWPWVRYYRDPIVNGHF